MSHLAFPFAIDARGRTAGADGDAHLRDLIRLVLFTAPGERVNRPEFGCALRQLVFEPNSSVLAAAAGQLVHAALRRWLDPVLLVDGVEVTVGDATLDLIVRWRRRDNGTAARDTFSTPLPA